MGHATYALEIALSYSGRVALATLAQLALVLGPPLVLVAVAQPVALHSERWTERLVGRRARWVAVGWIATTLHELGHAAFALLFGHQVRRVKWFDYHAAGGTHGQVEHEYDPASVYQRAGRFFIGIGPVVLGVLVLALAARFLLGVQLSAAHPLAPEQGPATLGAATSALAAQLGASVRDLGHFTAAMTPGRWRTWLFIYVVYVSGSAMRLSWSDLRSFGAGMRTLGGLLLLANALTLWAGTLGTSLALRAGRALALCDVALLAAVVLQLLVGAVALALSYAVAALGTRAGALAGG